MYRIGVFFIFSFLASALFAEDAPTIPHASPTAEGQIDEPAGVLPSPPANSLVRIVDPFVADRLALTESQRVEAMRLVNVQVLEISNAQSAGSPPERFLEIYKQTEENLANLLTATQRAVLEQGLDGTKFRMVFRNLPWRDVLQLIADQGRYQMIMDAPPPGTFNYSDPEERSIVEVLDLINSILITNGYSIVRRDRILQVLDLRKPIPNWVFPSVRPDDLHGRASSEFVSVQYDLERRNREQIRQSIVPLENPYTRIFELSGNKLLVIDRVEIQNAIRRIIDRTENPPPPARPQAAASPTPPPPPEWKTYIIEKNDPAKIEEVFKEYAPNLQMLRLENSREIHVFLPMPDHERLTAILSMLEADSGAVPPGDVRIPGHPGPALAVVVFSPKNIGLETLQTVIKDIYPHAGITTDLQRGQLVIRIRPEQKELLQSFLEQLDADDPDTERRFFKPYPLTSGFYSIRADWSRYAPVQFVADLQTLAPRAKISFDEQSQQLIVWGTDEEHTIIEAAVRNLIGDGSEKRFQRYELRKIAQWTIMPILRRMFPTVQTSFDYDARALIVEGHPSLFPRIKELIEVLDSAEVSENDPVVRFYALRSEPTREILDVLRRFAPWPSQIVPDRLGKQIMVLAKPAEHQVIAANVELILGSFTPPEEPVLYIYEADRAERTRLESFMQVAASELPGARILPDTPTGRGQQNILSGNQISIWARPSEHELIANVLEQIKKSQANVPERLLRSFPMSIAEMSTAQNILRTSNPGVQVFPDESGNRLMVLAAADDMQKVAETLRIQGNIDDRQMIAYSIVGVQTATLRSAILEIFRGLRITEEPKNRKLLVWASPDEHVRVARIIEEANREVDPESELAEKFVAYSAYNLDLNMVLPLFQAIIPEADVHTSSDSDKIVVRAIARDHKRIEHLFSQLRERDDSLRPRLEVYFFGDTDPIMVEAMLRNQLPNAESMSPDDLIQRLGWSYYYERMPWYRSETQIQPVKFGYFQIDPQTRTVHVFVTDEQHQEVNKAMQQLLAASSQEGLQLTVRRYTLDVSDFWDVRQLFQRVAPSALFQQIWEQHLTPDGWYNWRATGEFLAYTFEAEHEKLEAIVRELNDQTGMNSKEILILSLPDNTPFSRDRIIETIHLLYTDITPIPGGLPHQIFVWAPQHRLKQIQAVFDEITQPLPAGQRSVPRNYPLRFIDTEEAIAWLSILYPNVVFEPSRTTDIAPGDIAPGSASSPSDARRFLIALATPLEHAEMEKTIRELDKDLPDSHRLHPRTYALDDMPGNEFWRFTTMLNRAFPNAVFAPMGGQTTVMAIASDEEHQRIALFVKAYREDVQQISPLLEIYTLTRQNYYNIFPLISRIAPAAFHSAGTTPQQVNVIASPKEHLDIAHALAKLETAAEVQLDQKMVIYKTGQEKSGIAQEFIQGLFPGVIAVPINPNEIIVWAAPSVHEAMASSLEMIAEIFPDPITRPYHFRHVPLNEVHWFLSQAFEGSATFIPRATGDLLVHATPDVHKKIAASIKEIDVPNPIDARSIPKIYDLSDLSQEAFWTIFWQIREALHYRIQILQGVSDGQMVVWGKPADIEIVDKIVEQMLTERPEATAQTKVYTLQRGSNVQNVQAIIPAIAPNATAQPITGSNQIMVLARPADHIKIDNAIKELNESEPDILVMLHPLKNINYFTATMILATLRSERGHDIRVFDESFGNQLVVLANPDDQKMIAGILDSIRAEDRELLAVQLDYVDPITAQTAIETMFADESLAARPRVSVDQHTNMIFVQGMPPQLNRVARLLRDMGEEAWYPRESPNGHQPGESRPLGQQPGSIRQPGPNIRTIHIRGNPDILRELQRHWNQSQPNPLQIIDQTATPPQFSLDNEIQRDEIQREIPHHEPAAPTPEDQTAEDQTAENQTTEQSTGHLPSELPIANPNAAPPVYLVVNADGSMTITSTDTVALDQLESLLDRINRGILFEGRDYTIYSVRNINVDVVYGRLALVLRERLTPQNQQIPGMPIRPQLNIHADRVANTIYVQGTRADRNEVGRLIAQFDVSELPGTRQVQRPVSVPILNTEAGKVWTEVMNVYQQKMMMTQLPGGITPRIAVNAVSNTLEIFAPEPLLSELREYIEEVDQKAQDEPGRKLHVIQLDVKAQVIQNVIQQLRQPYVQQHFPYMHNQQPFGMMPMQPYMVPMQQSFGQWPRF